MGQIQEKSSVSQEQSISKTNKYSGLQTQPEMAKQISAENAKNEGQQSVEQWYAQFQGKTHVPVTEGTGRGYNHSYTA